MTCELGSEVVCHPIDTFTTQQNDNDILSALLRTSLLRSTCPVVHTDVLRTISATQQANSLRNVVTPAPPSRDFFDFRRISAVCLPPMTYAPTDTVCGGAVQLKRNYVHYSATNVAAASAASLLWVHPSEACDAATGPHSRFHGSSLIESRRYTFASTAAAGSAAAYGCETHVAGGAHHMRLRAYGRRDVMRPHR